MILTGAVAVNKLLLGNYSLQELAVSDNYIGDDGISVIVEQLQYITTLTTLHVMKCGLSVKGTAVFARYTYLATCICRPVASLT